MEPGDFNKSELDKNSSLDDKQENKKENVKEIEHEKRKKDKEKEHNNEIKPNNEIKLNKIKEKQEIKEFYISNFYLKLIFDFEDISMTIRGYNLEKLDGMGYEKKLSNHQKT